jgi:hypothetical protein
MFPSRPSKRSRTSTIFKLQRPRHTVVTIGKGRMIPKLARSSLQVTGESATMKLFRSRIAESVEASNLTPQTSAAPHDNTGRPNTKDLQPPDKDVLTSPVLKATQAETQLKHKKHAYELRTSCQQTEGSPIPNNQTLDTSPQNTKPTSTPKTYQQQNTANEDRSTFQEQIHRHIPQEQHPPTGTKQPYTLQ